MSQHHHMHLQSLVDLEVQSAIYAVTEVLARLLKAVAAHQDGTSAFFDAYVGSYNIRELVDWMGTIDRDALGQMLQLPTSADVLAESVKDFGTSISPAEAEYLVELVHRAFDELALNLKEFALTVKQVDLSGVDAPVSVGHSLRTVDNAYRHGLKLLLHDSVPIDRSFGVAVHREADPVGEYAIDLYQSNTEPKFATIDARPERTEEHMQAIEAICVRIKQVTRAFMARLSGHWGLLATFPQIDTDEIDFSLQDAGSDN
jgi:hypothetical protein